MNAIVRIPAAPAITTFTFDGHTVRVVHVDGDPRFVAADVCKALKLTNPSVSLKALDEDERAKIFLGHPQGEASVVTESGLYTLIMRCQKALIKGSTAWRFRRKVTKEILPEIRRTGGYNAAPPVPVAAPEPVDPMAFLMNPRNMMMVLDHYTRRTVELEVTVARQGRDLQIAEHTIEQQAVTVEAHDRLTNADGSSCISDTAKRLGVGPKALFAYMRNPEAKVRWLLHRATATEETPHQDRLNAGEMICPVETVTVHPRNEPPRDKLVTRVRVTPKGLTRLARLIVEGKDPLLPVPSDMLHVLGIARDRHLFD